MLTKDERTAILDREVQKYVKSGYRVNSRTDTTAQLVQPKKFSFLLFIVLLILMVLPAVLYVVWYMVKKEGAIYLTVDENGKIKRS